MVATKDSAVQPIAVGFQCCSCCGQPGRKRPTCSCHKKTGKIHQCLKLYQKEQEKQAEQEKLAQKGQEKQAERRSTRKWTYIVFAMLQMPEKHEEEEDEETNPEWQVIDRKQ